MELLHGFKLPTGWYGALSQTQGNHRKTMEDRVSVNTQTDESTKETEVLIGVFDGHGGSDVAEYLSHHLLTKLQSQPNLTKWTEIFHSMDEEIKDDVVLKQQLSMSMGSTATVCRVIHATPPTSSPTTTIQCANAGDSHALFFGWEDGSTITPINLTAHHTPRSEEVRIRDSGGMVIRGAMALPEYTIAYAVSRSFGDYILKTLMIPTPEFGPEIVTTAASVGDRRRHSLIIIASDGLWNGWKKREDMYFELTHFAAAVAVAPHILQQQLDVLLENATDRAQDNGIAVVLYWTDG